MSDDGQRSADRREQGDAPIASWLGDTGMTAGQLTVALSNELVQLLSSQLYSSPLKAIEELVVNAYDAGAGVCRVYVPDGVRSDRFTLVFDDGDGMDYEGLVNLWHIGRSNKRTEEVAKRVKRKQIGKFGIGKLATYAIADKVTYITLHNATLLSVTLDFRDFGADASGAGPPIQLTVRRPDVHQLAGQPSFIEACEALGLDPSFVTSDEQKHWTMVILEALKPKAIMSIGRLRHVLSTAMPLRSDFRVYLNLAEVVSSKAQYEVVAQFAVTELPKKRLESIESATGVCWRVEGDRLFSDCFPSGVTGTAIVTKQSLHVGKSADIIRSNGFFVRSRGRLINETDELFGLSPLSYETFNRFRAELDADDLDPVITAPREGVEESDLKGQVQALLAEVFYEARSRYDRWLQDDLKKELQKREHDRAYVAPRLVERPIADVLSAPNNRLPGAEADESWFYLSIEPTVDLTELVRSLYSSPRTKYRYEYTNAGASERLVQFSPVDSTFYLNADHPIVQAGADDPRSRLVLEDFVTAEALLEVYLREVSIPGVTIGAVLERRDSLLRSLAEDHPYSLDSIAQALRRHRSDERNLEVDLVASARALGFVATHISGAGEPDGLARFTDYPTGEQKITLEAKASGGTPSLAQLDLAGVAEHVRKRGAKGCLLVAPGYPGKDRGEASAVAERARAERISCWTVDQLARVVESAEARQITARHVLDIVLQAFDPDAVTAAIGTLLQQPDWSNRRLYTAVLTALKTLEGRLVDRPRTIDLVSAEISRTSEFTTIRHEAVERAVRDLAAASQGALGLSDDRIILSASVEELERRLDGMTRKGGPPRRSGTFRESGGDKDAL